MTTKNVIESEFSGPRQTAYRLLVEEAGQDLVEYALLAGFIGVVGIALWQNIVAGIGTGYNSWDTGTQSLWEPSNPI